MNAVKEAGSALLDVFHQLDFVPASAEGVWVVDTAGRRYLDFYGGHAVALLGYAHPRLLSVLAEQARTLFFQSNLVDLDVRQRAATALAKFAGDPSAKVFFVNSGAEANENALRTAFLLTKRKRVCAVTGAFHGRTAAAAAVTDHNEKWYGFPQRPFEIDWVEADDCAGLDRAIGSDTAAFIAEAVQGIAGARPLAAGFLTTARRLTSERGALYIADEVQCGMGRSGYPFAVDAYGIVPDLWTTAKGLGGGFPVAALIVQEKIAKSIKKGDLGTTFGGGPLACALAEAVVDEIDRAAILANVRRLSERIKREALIGPVTAIQGMGFLLGLRTHRPAKDVLTEMRARGVLAGSSHDPHVMRLMPPLLMEDEHVDRLIECLSEISR